VNEDWAKEVAGEIAKCDTALGNKRSTENPNVEERNPFDGNPNIEIAFLIHGIRVIRG